MLAGLALLLASDAAAVPAEGACGIYSHANYEGGGAWSGCELKKAGEKPLWREPRDPTINQIVRFVFSSGRDNSFRFVTLIQPVDGRSRVVSGGVDAQYRQPRRVWPRRSNTITVQDWNELDQLAEASGAFNFAAGSWDGDEIYVHCQNLAMERVNRAGYRFSSVSISCNHPEKLLPLVTKVIALSGRDSLFTGWRPQ